MDILLEIMKRELFELDLGPFPLPLLLLAHSHHVSGALSRAPFDTWRRLPVMRAYKM